MTIFPNPYEPTLPFSVRIPAKVYDKIHVASGTTGVAPMNIVRAAIVHGVDQAIEDAKLLQKKRAKEFNQWMPKEDEDELNF